MGRAQDSSAARRRWKSKSAAARGCSWQSAAASNPAHDFLGIEIATKYARFAAARIARNELTNAVMVHGDAQRIFTELLPDESLAAVHVYFPDPWWKKRHHKRRVMNERFVQAGRAHAHRRRLAPLLDRRSRAVRRNARTHRRADNARRAARSRRAPCRARARLPHPLRAPDALSGPARLPRRIPQALGLATAYFVPLRYQRTPR